MLARLTGDSILVTGTGCFAGAQFAISAVTLNGAHVVFTGRPQGDLVRLLLRAFVDIECSQIRFALSFVDRIVIYLIDRRLVIDEHSSGFLVPFALLAFRLAIVLSPAQISFDRA